RQHRKCIVVELGRAEGEHGKSDQHPKQQEEERAVARGLWPERAARQDAPQHSRKREYPGEAVESELLDEVRERPARSGRMDAEDEPLEMVVDDEPLEERLSFVILSGEREHREIPGRRDRKDDESSGQESQAPQP